MNKIGRAHAPSDLQLHQPGNLVLDISEVPCNSFERIPEPAPESPGEGLPVANHNEFKWGRRKNH